MDEMKESMEKSIAHYREELKNLRTNRPNPSMLDGVSVLVYGSEMRLRDIATVSVADKNQLLISPFDPNNANPIAKAIEKANLDLLPIVDKGMIRIPLPQMSEERRKEIAKDAKQKGEKAKVTIRENRRRANDRVEKEKGNGEISEDELKRCKKQIQEFTEQLCKKVDTLYADKERDLMEV